jgi:hypothetical protein
MTAGSAPLAQELDIFKSSPDQDLWQKETLKKEEKKTPKASWSWDGSQRGLSSRVPWQTLPS